VHFLAEISVIVIHIVTFNPNYGPCYLKLEYEMKSSHTQNFDHISARYKPRFQQYIKVNIIQTELLPK